MRIGYLLSSLFPYKRLISPDAGPAIAQEYGWIISKLPDLHRTAFAAVVIDNRHHNREELDTLRSHILSNSSRPILLRVNDPYFFHSADPWYQFCASLLDVEHVHFLTPYQPTGILSYWLSQSPAKRFIYAPFTYDTAQELPCNHRQRIQRIAVSGNQRGDLYPLRFWIQRASKFRITRSLFRTERLNHPGYPEKTATAHQVVGSNFVQWLARHTAAFTDSSIYRIELLKYREIAYAGCVPVGDLPWSLFECPDSALMHYQSLADLLLYRKILKDVEVTQSAAMIYRSFLRQHRCRHYWRLKVAEAIAHLI